MRKVLCIVGAVLCTALATACAAQSLTVQPPTSNTNPTPVTVSWDVPGGTACQAAGAWTGAKAAQGSEQITVTKTSAFSLTCTTPTPPVQNQLTVTWSPPTNNAQGSPLSADEAITGYTLYLGRGNPPTTATQLPASPQSYTVTGLNGGLYYLQMTASNKAGESARTDVISSAEPEPVAGTAPTTVSGTVTVTAPAGPSPPGKPQSLKLS